MLKNASMTLIWEHGTAYHRKNPIPFKHTCARSYATSPLHAIIPTLAVKRNSHYDVALEELQDCLCSADTPELALEAKELSHLLDRFLAALDTRSRVMFVRRYWYSDSIIKIAEDFRMKPNSVSVQLSRIRNKLRRFLTQEGYRI